MSEEKIYIIKSSQLEYDYPGVKDKDPNFYKHIIPCNFKEDNSKKSFIPTIMDSYALFPDSLNMDDYQKIDNVLPFFIREHIEESTLNVKEPSED